MSSAFAGVLRTSAIRSGLLPAALALLAVSSSGQTLPGEQALVLRYAPASMLLGASVADLVAGDVDHDGDLDLLSADSSANLVRILVNQGAAGFAQTTLSVGAAPSALALGDVDGDGDLDLVVGLGSQLRLLRNDGAGHFTAAAPVAFAGADSTPVGLFLQDVDGDGRLDALVGLSHHSLPSGSYTGGLAVAFGDGAGGFALQPTHALSLPAFNLVVADFDGDGQWDAAELGGYVSASMVNLAFGAGDGTFVNGPTGYSAGMYAGGLACGDWDGDGAVDLATGGKYDLRILGNDGSGAFTTGQHLNPGYYVKGIAAGDLDRDGDLDLLATSGSAAAMRLLINAGGQFTPTASLPASVQGYAVLLADTSGDGYPDPWAGDVYGQLSHGDSQCLVARYGTAKLNSLGSLPAMTAQGQPLLGASDFVVQATGQLILQPALLIAGLAPTSLPLLKGQLLVAEPWALLPATTSAGSGDPLVSDGSITLPVSSADLGLLGAGTRVYLQAWSADPGQTDGTHASLSDGLWFEVAAP